MTKIKVSVTIDEELHNKIKSASEKNDRNFSNQLNVFLKDYFKDKN